MKIYSMKKCEELLRIDVDGCYRLFAISQQLPLKKEHQDRPMREILRGRKGKAKGASA